MVCNPQIACAAVTASAAMAALTSPTNTSLAAWISMGHVVLLKEINVCLRQNEELQLLEFGVPSTYPMQIGRICIERLCEGRNPRGGQEKCSNQILQHRLILHTDSCQDLPGKNHHRSRHCHLIPRYSALRPETASNMATSRYVKHVPKTRLHTAEKDHLSKIHFYGDILHAFISLWVHQVLKSGHSNGLKRFRDVHCQTYQLNFSKLVPLCLHALYMCLVAPSINSEWLTQFESTSTCPTKPHATKLRSSSQGSWIWRDSFAKFRSGDKSDIFIADNFMETPVHLTWSKDCKDSQASWDLAVGKRAEYNMQEVREKDLLWNKAVVWRLSYIDMPEMWNKALGYERVERVIGF